MALKIIGAGLGRTGTLSLKLALEHLGFGPCYHAMELAASLRRALPMWNEAIRGTPDWAAIFDGYSATTDYPGCCFWRELASFYPAAKVILTVRDPDDWFDSVTATIFSTERKNPPLLGAAGADLSRFLRRDFGEHIGDRTFMTSYFRRWNQSVMDAMPAERLLVFPANDGWDPLCTFLAAPTPAVPYPREHARPAGLGQPVRLSPDPAEIEVRLRKYLDDLGRSTFEGAGL